MAISVEAKIVNGLMSHFQGFALPADVAVAYPDVDFTPNGRKHVRLSVAPNTPLAPHISGSLTIHRGILLAVICWPPGGGIVEALELAGSIREHFAFNDAKDDRRVISHDGIEIRIGVEFPPRIASSEPVETFTETPVTIPWTVYP